jgi:hypothetical protein
MTYFLPHPTFFYSCQFRFTLCSNQREYEKSLDFSPLPKKIFRYASLLQHAGACQPRELLSLRGLLQGFQRRAASRVPLPEKARACPWWRGGT